MLRGIFVLSGGIVKDPAAPGGWRSTNYDEQDEGGTLGGYARVQAAAYLARIYSSATLVAMSDDGQYPVSYAQVLERELIALGVAPQRILREERSHNTETQVVEALTLATARDWREVMFVTSEYHLPRVDAFVQKHRSLFSGKIYFETAEDQLQRIEPGFADQFAAVKETPAYRKRLDSEARGLAALQSGTYQPLADDKKIAHR